MVITCPSCAARYRLNPDKVQGRGAKITCPKCSHVFVVFTDQDGEDEAESASPKVRSTPRPAAPPTSETDKRSATQTGAFRAVGVAPEPVGKNSKNSVRIVAPGPRSTRRVRALSTPASAPPSAGTAPGDSSEPPAALDISSAKELDFRAVGIKTWKVKVAIGLIYDFSDIATLQKYLADKKVTPDDLISHNNEDWIRIGDIPDLEAHFISTWKSAKAAIDSGDAPKPAAKKKVTTPGAPLPSSAPGSDSFRLDGGRGRSTGNFTAPAPPRRRVEAEPEEEEPNHKRSLLILAAVLVLGGIAWSFLQPTDAPVVEAPTPPQAIGELGPTDAELERIQEGIRQKLAQERDKFTEELQTPAEGVAEGTDAPERELVPVPPSERSTPSPTVQPTIPKYTPPPKPPVAQAEPQTPAPARATVKEKSGDPSRMYLDAGRKKLAAGDYGSARKMFLAAISKNGSCGECYRGLAAAEKELGNTAGADAANKKADSLGNTQSLARP